MKLWHVAVLCTLTACASPPSPVVAPQPLVSYADGVAVYNGPLEPDSMKRLRTVIGERPVARLRIRSGGGEVGGAIELARWVHANGIDVEVDGACFSSCANYIFPAGRKKYIVGKGIVGWHGTLTHLLYRHERGIKPVDANALPSLKEMVAMERAFFADTGINSFTGWFGKMPPYSVYNMYYLSPSDMAYMGLRDLHVRSDYLQSDSRTWFPRDPAAVRLLTIDRTITSATAVQP